MAAPPLPLTPYRDRVAPRWSAPWGGTTSSRNHLSCSGAQSPDRKSTESCPPNGCSWSWDSCRAATDPVSARTTVLSMTLRYRGPERYIKIQFIELILIVRKCNKPLANQREQLLRDLGGNSAVRTPHASSPDGSFAVAPCTTPCDLASRQWTRKDRRWTEGNDQHDVIEIV